MQIYDEYEPRGVVFLGLTTKGASEAQSFVEACRVPWPCGYGVGSKMPVLLGVASRVVILGPDGRVLWQHRDDTVLAKSIVDVIEHELPERFAP